MQTLISKGLSDHKIMLLKAAMHERAKGLSSWISETDKSCANEQLHLDSGSSERLYWHIGYLVALRDILNQLSSDQPHK